MGSKKKKISSEVMSEYLESVANAVRYFFNEVGKLSYKTSFKAFVITLLLIILVFVGRIAVSRNSVDKFVEMSMSESKREEANLFIRDMVSPKIQKRLAKIVVLLECDRAFVIEMHNGKKNATELPFKYFDMTYEEVDETKNVKNVSEGYVETMITHYKLPYFLSRYDTFFGTVEELEPIDKRFAMNLADEHGRYLAIEILRSGGKEVGFLGVAYNEGTPVPSEEKIKKVFDTEVKLIAELLDLNVQESLLEKKEKENE